MKRIFFAIAMICALQAGAATVKVDTVVHYTYVSIRPVLAYPDTATRLRVVQLFDNLEADPERAQTVFHWYMMNESSKVLADGDLTIEKEDYEEWNSDSLENTYLMVANKLKLNTISK
jgi:hypothetical protein